MDNYAPKINIFDTLTKKQFFLKKNTHSFGMQLRNQTLDWIRNLTFFQYTENKFPNIKIIQHQTQYICTEKWMNCAKKTTAGKFKMDQENV